jgi:hypothetical protein
MHHHVHVQLKFHCQEETGSYILPDKCHPDCRLYDRRAIVTEEAGRWPLKRETKTIDLYPSHA